MAKPERPLKGYTIGEVVNQVKDEFEDISVSKIRFLENEGLIYPDRTESGYRIYTDDDVNRLRYILTAQRDHYLPLKVIHEQLNKLDAGQAPENGPKPPKTLLQTSHDIAKSPVQQAMEVAKTVQSAGYEYEGVLTSSDVPDIQLGMREFCEATGLETPQVRALRDYLVVGNAKDDTATFDFDDLVTGLAARDLLSMGLDARHLGTYRRFSDKQVSEFEQLAMPLLRQRNPEAQRQASAQLEKLASLTARLQKSLLSRELRKSLRNI